jgi:hypothetical protein
LRNFCLVRHVHSAKVAWWALVGCSIVTMMPDYFDERFIVHNNVCLAAYATPQDRFYAPTTIDDTECVYKFLESLSDGSVISVAIRVFVPF